jgi:hypothetical protein
MLGTLNQRTDMDDPKWKFPTNNKKIVRQGELQACERIIDEIYPKFQY